MTEPSAREPGPRHESLKSLVGSWRVEMATYGDDGPIRSNAPLIANKCLFGDGRYIREEIDGEFGGARHQKLTLLGFNNTRGRYEYVTADNHDAVLLLYVSRPDAANDGSVIDLYTDYVSPGDAAPRGTLLLVRTRLELMSRDRHVLTNYYTEPGSEERKFLQYVYEKGAA